ncbi:MAG TPA: hypothetical protein VKT75_19495 [Acidobacteriaceae bacterium]|nr:hypothetical protein [Acidobacteriaceae bacterium]
MPSSTAVKQRSSAGAKPRKKRASRTGWGGWKALVPFLVCCALTPFAVQAASILALEGPKAFALLYPWVEVVRSPALHVAPASLETVSQWIMYLQFPVYGLLMALTFRAGRYLRAFTVGLLAHFSGLLLVVVLAYMAQKG